MDKAQLKRLICIGEKYPKFYGDVANRARKLRYDPAKLINSFNKLILLINLFF